jgi:branched-chain amino acid transport system ATP-binding protein
MNSTDASSALELSGVYAGYGDAEVLRGVDLSVRPGEIVAVVGANGAGKTTAVRCAMGLVPVQRGTVRLGDVDLTGAPPWARARHGIGCVPERRQVFGELSVRENLVVGAWSRRGSMSRGDVADRIGEVCELFPVLGSFMERPAELLSGGQQQMLAIGRALMSSPRILVLDEPSLGLAPALVAEIFGMIKRLGRETGVLLLEQNARAALGIADRGVLVAGGRVVSTGTGAELAASPDLMELYLGAGAQSAGELDRTGHAAAERLRAVLQLDRA